MYVTYTQNNSGGYLIGPEYIIIESDSIEDANNIFNDLELDHESCECCGSRWYDYSPEIHDNPKIMGKDLDNYTEVDLISLDKKDLENTYLLIKTED